MKRLIAIITLLIPIVCISGGLTTTTGGGADETPPFTFDILTLEEDDSFTPPLYNGGVYNFVIDWGDASSSTITAFDDEDLTHTYEDAGATQYSLSITGTLIGWKFDNGGDKSLMKVITQWGCFRPGNTGHTFTGCNNMTVTATDELNLSGVTTLSNFFQLCTSLTTVPGMGDWDISSITSIYAMFHSATLFQEDITGWDTGSCTNMGYTFYGANAFNQAIGGWDVADVTIMTWMFYNNTGFNGDISGWTTSSLTNVVSMFNGATAFNQDISGWDLSQTTDLTTMFAGATSFDQNLATLDISTITDMTNMFLNVTMSTANYSNTLIGWEGQTEQPNVTFHGGGSKYSAGAAATARAALVTNGWDITDGGQE